MNKGFEFWSSKNLFPFLAVYWAIFALFDLVGTGVAILTANPFYYFIMGVVPYPILKIYGFLHDRYDRIEESIRQADPELYNRSLQEGTKMTVLRMGSSEKAYNRGRLIVELLRTGKQSLNPKVAAYVKNVRAMDISSMVSLGIWFFTFMGLILYLYLTRS